MEQGKSQVLIEWLEPEVVGDEQPEITYRVLAEIDVQQASYDAEIFRRSLFILATNQAVNNAQDEAELLKTCKEQHSVERGFRFIKDPNIVVSSFFVRKPERIAALAWPLLLHL